ncbi:hypothetical protein Syun_021310 [Stephania yunnanensis]|uniref:Uncharacterized protein n=1 Tax=Stephania yunnanensis TaxID=152371 RepID=A0AAP0IGD0_9MAGN
MDHSQEGTTTKMDHNQERIVAPVTCHHGQRKSHVTLPIISDHILAVTRLGCLVLLYVLEKDEASRKRPRTIP